MTAESAALSAWAQTRMPLAGCSGQGHVAVDLRVCLRLVLTTGVTGQSFEPVSELIPQVIAVRIVTQEVHPC